MKVWQLLPREPDVPHSLPSHINVHFTDLVLSDIRALTRRDYISQRFVSSKLQMAQHPT